MVRWQISKHNRTEYKNTMNAVGTQEICPGGKFAWLLSSLSQKDGRTGVLRFTERNHIHITKLANITRDRIAYLYL